jgi:hypothetical protein
MLPQKIVIIAQTIFPSPLPRANRASELAKELARQGHDVTLYAVIGNYDYCNYEKEFNLKIKNIGKMMFSTLNSDGKSRNNILDKILRKCFNRLLEFPDIELMFRMPRLINNEENVDLLISIAMPFPIHWGCAFSRYLCRNSFPRIWVADCGDPYMGNKVLKKKKYFYFKYIEKLFCREANYITVPVEGAKNGYYPEFLNKIKVIPQGFRFDNIKLFKGNIENKIPTFAYAGIFYKDVRDPTRFLEFLMTINMDFKFVVYTPNDQLISPFFKSLGNKLEVRNYVPRDELLHSLSKMDFLVNFDNGTEVQSPSKLIDYMLVKRPILQVNSMGCPCEKLTKFLNKNYEESYVLNNFEDYNISNVADKFISLT